VFKKTIKNYVYPLIALFASAGGGYYCLSFGFESVKEIRQLERVPSSKVGALLQGEVNVTADASMYQRTVDSYYSKTPALYYKYIEEKENTDSDGNTSWSTVDTRSESVDFYIKDKTGKALINRAGNNINWSMPQSFSVTIGDRRFTEWRIEPGDEIFIFGFATLNGNQILIDFSSKGQYTPIISKYSEAEERSDMGAMSILQIWFGVTLLSLCVYFLAIIFKIHRLVAYLSILSITIALMLIDMGLTMMRVDLQESSIRYQTQKVLAGERVEYLLQRMDVPFHGWHDLHELKDERYENVDWLSKEKIKEIRINLLMSREKLIKAMSSTPEKWLLGMWGLSRPARISAPHNTRVEVEQRLSKYRPTQLEKFWPGMFSFIGILLSIFFLIIGMRLIKIKRHIENIATSNVSGVAYGLAEVKGELVLKDEKNALKSPLTNSQCAWYYYLVEEKRGSGKNAKWVTVTQLTESKEFYCKDRSGVIRIDAEKAEVITEHKEIKRSGSFKYTEKVLKLNDSLYVTGCADLDERLGENLHIGWSGDREPFIISNQSEQEVMIKKARKGILFLNMAFSSVVLSALLLFGVSGGFAPTDFLFASIISPVLMLFVVMILHYNDIIFLRQRVNRNSANIKVSLKKRFDLIPNIEDVIKGYSRHEKQLLDNIMEFRQNYKNTVENAVNIDELLKKQVKLKINVNSLREDYPELKANELINKMMDVLVALETELMYMRRGYNDAVEIYNTRIKSVPDVFFTGVFGFTEKEYITV